MKKERVRSKHGFKGFGVFLLGWFIGLISAIGILVGLGFWAYSSLSIRKIEKWTRNEITDNEGIENLTIKKVVGIVQGISENDTDAYTIAKIEEDFDIKLLDESFYGISTATLRNAPLKDIKQAFEDTIESITFSNIINFMDVDQDKLGLLNAVLENDVEYYIYNGKLYSDNTYTAEADFKYTIKDTTVEFANGSHTISIIDGVRIINPRLTDLPLATAVGSMTDATTNLKIYEILGYERTGTEGNYTYMKDDSKMSGVMASLAEYTIDDLADQNKLNNIYVWEVMGYKTLGGGEFAYINGQNQEVKVTGAIKALAGKTIGEISDPTTINGLYIYEVMGYYYNDADGYYYRKLNGNVYEEKVTGTMKTLAGKTIEELSDPNLVNNLKVWEVMGFDQVGTEGNYLYEDNGKPVEGVMATIAEKTISQLDDMSTFNDVTVADALGYYLNSDDNKYYYEYDEATDTYSEPVTGIYAHIAGTKISGLSTRINELSVGQVLDVDISQTSGVIKALYSTEISELSDKSTIDGIYIWQVMDYTESEGGEYTYIDSQGNPQRVTGAMKTLAGKTIGQLSDPNTINGLKIYEVLGYIEDGGKYYMYNTENGKYDLEVEGAIKALAGKTVGGLNDKDNGINSITLGAILDIDGTTTGVLKALSGFTLEELDGEIDKLQIHQVMDYRKDGDKYYAYNEVTEDYDKEVIGIMAAIAETNVNNIGETIDGLTAVEVLGADCEILKLIDESDRNNVLVKDLSERLVIEINNASLDKLVKNNIIKNINTESKFYNDIKDKSIQKIINDILNPTLEKPQ